MKKLLLLLFVPIFGFAQNQECATTPTQAQIDYLTQTRNARQSWNQTESILYLPVQHHVVQQTNGSGGLTSSDISSVMNALNTYYINIVSILLLIQ